jgi:threonine dehydratase
MDRKERATIASEILDEMPTPDVIFVPMGDTALIRGVAVEAKRRHLDVRIVGVQAEQAPAYVACEAIHGQPRIAASISTNAVSFSSACTTKRFPSRYASTILSPRGIHG